MCKVSVKSADGFADVKETDFYYEATLWGNANEIVQGIGNNVFAPGAKCTRAQAVTFLYRLAGSPEVSGDCGFADVPDSYYRNAVIWAAEKKITSGTSATTFSPDETCTRDQAVTFLYRYTGAQASEKVSSFTDVTDTNAFYYDAVIWAAENGVALGLPDGSFLPNALCSRGEIVTFIYRAAA